MKLDSEKSIHIVEEYKEDILSKKTQKHSLEEWEILDHRIWAIDEVQRRIKFGKDDPLAIVSEFIFEVTGYIIKSDLPQPLELWQTARCTAEEILYLLKTENEL